MRDAAGQVQAQKKQITATEEKILQEKQRLSAIDGGSNARLVSEKEERIRERESLIIQAQELETEFGSYQSQLKVAKDSSLDIQKLINGKKGEIDNVRNRAQELRGVQNEYMLAYGPQMQSLLRAINEEARKGNWRENPVGPLGQHITLLKQDWSLIIETILGNGLSGFVVTNYDDQRLLRTLMNQLRWYILRQSSKL